MKRKQDEVDSAGTEKRMRNKEMDIDDASSSSIPSTQPVAGTQPFTVTSSYETLGDSSQLQRSESSFTLRKGYIHNVSEIRKARPLGKEFFIFKFQTSESEWKTCFHFEVDRHSDFKRREAEQKGIITRKQKIWSNGVLVLSDINEVGDSQISMLFIPPPVSKIGEVFDKTYVDVKILVLRISTNEQKENGEDVRYKHAVIGDESGCAPFLVGDWATESISENRSYCLKYVMVVKEGERKYLKTTVFTQFQPCENVECFTPEQEVQDLLTVLKPHLHKGTVVAVDEIKRYKKCLNCNGEVVKTEDIFTCMSCKKSQIERKLKDEIHVMFNLEDEEEQENTKMYTVFSEVLKNYFTKYTDNQNLFEMSDIQIKRSLLGQMLSLSVRNLGEVIAMYPYEIPGHSNDGALESGEEDQTSKEEPVDDTVTNESEVQYTHT